MSVPNPSNRATAHKWARAGYPVFPCRPDKTPATPRGFYDATVGAPNIDLWWDAMPEALVGVPTGRVSGLVVLDSDRREGYDGEEALYELEKRYGALPNTWVCLTPSGGQHRIFLAPDYPVANSAGKLGTGLDIRGDGGYVIVAGSMLPDGRGYEMEASSPPSPTTMPAWLLKLLGGSPGPQKVQEPRTGESVAEGGRNHYLASYCGRLAHAGLSVEQVRVAVQAENQRACVPPLPDSELERTVLKSTATKWVRTGETVTDTLDLAIPPTWDEFCALDIPPLTPVLGPFTTQQLCLIHAQTGVGKTMFALALARALADGREFLGWQSHYKATVLYLDGEMPGAMMQQRLGGGGRGLHIANLTHWAAQQGVGPVNIATPDGQAIVSAWADMTHADFLILDNLMSLAFVAGTSLSSDEFWAPILPWMIKQRGEGRTVILIDHSNTGNTVHGTKTKTWHMDLGMVLSGVGEDIDPGMVRKSPRIKVAFEKVRSPLDPDVYREKIATIADPGKAWDWAISGQDLKAQAMEMKANGMNYKDISTDTGIPLKTLYRWFPKGGKP